MVVNDDRTEFSMSLAATLASIEIAPALGCTETEALERLLASETGEELYDDSLKLWWESPAIIAELYLARA